MANVDLNQVRAKNAKQEEAGLAFVSRDYWEVINWTGRIVRTGKHHLSLKAIYWFNALFSQSPMEGHTESTESRNYTDL